MSEFFGILAAITGLISSGTKLSTQLSQFIDGFRSAPRDSQSLARELHELCSTLDRLWRSLSGTAMATATPRDNSPLLLELRDVLGSCGDRFEEVEKLVGTYMVREDDGIMTRRIKKWKWGFREKEVVALRIQLEVHNATLGVTLLLATHMGTTSIREAAGRIEQHIQEVKNKLANDGPKSTKASSPALRRYLDSCNALNILSLRPSPPIRSGSQLPRVVEHEGQRLRGHSQSVPPPETGLGGEDIGRSASAASMRPLRYRPTGSLQRRNSGIPQLSRAESTRRDSDPQPTRRDSDPQPMLRERYRRGKTAGQLEMQKKVAAAKELEFATDKIWADVRSLIDQNLPYEVLSEQLLQAQLRLEQAREKIGRRFGQGNSQYGKQPGAAAERGAIRQPQVEKSPVVVRDAESKGKAKDEKPKTKDGKPKTKDEKPKTKAQEKAKDLETKKKAKDEKSKAKAKVQKADAEAKGKVKAENVKIQAQEAALERPSTSERAMEAAKHRELILPKVRANHLERGSLLVRNPTIGRIVEESDQPAQVQTRLEKPWPVIRGSVPFSTRVYKSNVCKEVLDEDEIEYTEEDESFIIHRNVSMLDQMGLRIRTNQIRGI